MRSIIRPSDTTIPVTLLSGLAAYQRCSPNAGGYQCLERCKSSQTATLAQVNGILNSIRLPVAPGQTVGALPLDFFSARIPEGFASRTANSFDIRTLEGLKLYRARQVVRHKLWYPVREQRAALYTVWRKDLLLKHIGETLHH